MLPRQNNNSTKHTLTTQPPGPIPFIQDENFGAKLLKPQINAPNKNANVKNKKINAPFVNMNNMGNMANGGDMYNGSLLNNNNPVFNKDSTGNFHQLQNNF